MFFSDNPRELDAAAVVGLRVVQVLRDGRANKTSFPSIASFAEIEPEVGP